MLKGRQRGVTLIELAIGLAIMGILLTVALPSFTVFLQNTQIKNAAETTLSGLTLARTEAVRRNATVRFQLVSTLTSACALSPTSLHWVVSRADPSGACDAAPSDTLGPQIVQKKSGQEGSRNVTVTATGGSTVVFNALGRMVGVGITQVDFANATGTCEHLSASGTLRCLRIMVSSAGQLKMCDPKVNVASTDPRRCV